MSIQVQRLKKVVFSFIYRQLKNTPFAKILQGVMEHVCFILVLFDIYINIIVVLHDRLIQI